MATVRQYFNNLKNARDQIVGWMGSTAATRPSDDRALANATLAAVAIVVKALTDKGVISDAELAAARDAALAELWDVEPPTP